MENLPNWPLMEEEILIVEDEKNIYFNFPYSLYKKGIEKEISRLPVTVTISEDSLGGKRALVVMEKQLGAEVKAWLSVKLPSLNKKYFITELEII
jgi:hypothetical protein